MTKKKEKEESKAVRGGASGGPFQRDHIADPSDLELGLLWIQLEDGSFVNAASEPRKFDEAVAQHLDFFDRIQWPTAHRTRILQENSDVIPVFRINPEDLPEDLRKAYQEIEKPEEVSDAELTDQE